MQPNWCVLPKSKFIPFRFFFIQEVVCSMMFFYRLSSDDLKRIHTALRKAAGLFRYVETALLPALRNRPQGGSAETDIDARILCAYINQCTAEAQESKSNVL